MIKQLLEIDSCIKSLKSNFKKCVNENEKFRIANSIEQLEQQWIDLANCEYPMFLNENNKKCDIKNVIQKNKSKKNNEYKLPSIDDVIERNVNNYNLVINTLYDKNYASDHVNPYRKRKK